jgi:4'-phosphopantetheinyl transferase EntD
MTRSMTCLGTTTSELATGRYAFCTQWAIALDAFLIKHLPSSLSGAALPVTDHSVCLHPFERELIGGARRKRLATFSTGRCVARRALARVGLRRAHIGKDPFGAPTVQRGWLLSIAHTDEVAIAVAGRTRDYRYLGCDVEVRSRVTEDLIGAISSNDELQSWQEHGFGFAELFAAKEAAYKALSGDFDHAITLRDLHLICETSDRAQVRWAEHVTHRPINASLSLLAERFGMWVISLCYA